jgi:putative membrane protein
MAQFTRHLLLIPFLLGPAAAGVQAPPSDLTDPEVAHVAVTANTIDIELAQLAQTRMTNPAVKQFAATMIADHSAVNAKAGALAKKLNVTPKDNAVSQSLLSGAATARAALEKQTGKAFEKGYVEREVAYHQAVLDAIDKLLIPTTENAELKQLLTEVRPAIAAHLEHAKRLNTTLAVAR